MRVPKVLVAAAATLLMTGLGVPMANAADSGSADPESIVINGRTYGPEDGLEVVTETFEVTPGDSPTGATYGAAPGGISTQAVWGSSYAFSKEVLLYDYLGYAKAGGNVIDNKRIVRVCFWWTQAARTSATTCANATFSGGRYSPGPEVTGYFRDSNGLNDPKSIFHIQTSRIDPRL